MLGLNIKCVLEVFCLVPVVLHLLLLLALESQVFFDIDRLQFINFNFFHELDVSLRDNFVTGLFLCFGAKLDLFITTLLIFLNFYLVSFRIQLF